MNEYVKTLKTSDGAIIIYPETMACGVFMDGDTYKGPPVVREGANRNRTVQEAIEELRHAWENATFDGWLTANNVRINGNLYLHKDDNIENFNSGEGARVLVLDVEDKVCSTTPARIMELGGIKRYLPLAGGTLTYFLKLHADPVEPLQAVPRQYVDRNFDLLLKNFTVNNINFTPTGSHQKAPTAGTNKLATTSYVSNMCSNLITVSKTQPPGSNYAIGSLWIDTQDGKDHYLRYWSGKAWLAVPVAWT